jgi:hypothetical protein
MNTVTVNTMADDYDNVEATVETTTSNAIAPMISRRRDLKAKTREIRLVGRR